MACNSESVWDHAKHITEKLMNEVGVEIIKGHEVKKIISNGKKITGIQLDNQTNIETNNVICNADPPAVYEKII